MDIRHLESSDFDFVSEVVDEWWGGRPVRGLLPRLFFEHFRPSSFALETNGATEGFLVGFSIAVITHRRVHSSCRCFTE